MPSGCPQIVAPDTPDASDAPEAPEGPSQAGTNKSHHIVDKGPVMQDRESRILIFNLGPWPCQWRDLGCDQRKHEGAQMIFILMVLVSILPDLARFEQCSHVAALLGASEVSFVQVKVSDAILRSHEVPVHGAPCELKSTRGYTKSVEPWPDR